MKEEPARLLEHRTVYQGPVFAVDKDRVRLRGGQIVEFDIVRHGGSVVLIPMPDPGRVVLIRQYRHAIDRWIWELPAGLVEKGEDPETAARRECEEETGLVAGEVAVLGSYYPSPGFCDEIMLFYRLSSLAHPQSTASPAAMDEDEDIEVHVFTLSEAREMVRNREIIDMKTALGLTLIRA